MTTNVGFTDRLIRLAVAGNVFSLYFFLPAPSRYVAFLGLIPFATGLMGWCPLYSLFGVKTCTVR